jgi:hypothetical protein
LGLSAKASHDSGINAWAGTEDGLRRYATAGRPSSRARPDRLEWGASGIWLISRRSVCSTPRDEAATRYGLSAGLLDDLKRWNDEGGRLASPASLAGQRRPLVFVLIRGGTCRRTRTRRTRSRLRSPLQPRRERVDVVRATSTMGIARNRDSLHERAFQSCLTSSLRSASASTLPANSPRTSSKASCGTRRSRRMLANGPGN